MYKLEGLNTKTIGRNLIQYREIDSTQKEIWRRIENGSIKNGTIVLTDIQTNGIGTHGRTWYASNEGDIILSILICPNVNVEKLSNLTIEIAEIIVGVFEKIYKINLNIKEPNDIVYNNKKIGGILTETKLINGIVKYLVIGIGINTNKKEFETEIKDIATSIANEFGININNEIVITEFCNELEKRITKMLL